jgi:UDP-glucose 4-epimerase
MNNFNDIGHGYSRIRVLVLGACGFIGRWVAHYLSCQGAQLYLIDHDQSKFDVVFPRYDIQGEFCELDLGEFEKIIPIIQKIKPSITFNLAGYGVDRSERDIELAYKINTHLVDVICKSLALSKDPGWRGQDLVHVGSALEYGMIKGNLSEDSVPQPTTWYGKSKLGGTNSLTLSCKASGIKGVTTRLFTIYGPGEHEGRLLPSLLEAAKTGNPLPLTAGQQKRDFTYVEDVAEGLLRIGLIPANSSTIVNLATGKLTPVRRFAEIAAEILHIPFEKLEFGAIPTRKEEMDHDPVSIKRLSDLTAWIPPTSVAEGIRKTMMFEKVHD